MAEHEQQGGTAVAATVKRRGILAAAGAAVAALVARQTSQPVAASSGSGDQGFLALGSNPWYIAASPNANTPAISSAPTVIQATSDFGTYAGTNHADRTVFEVNARPATGDIDGITGFSQGYGSGVVGTSTSGTGVDGSSTSGTGVTGLSTSNTGVYGTSSSGRGVDGASISNFGVSGASDSSTGVSGISSSGIGVSGQSISNNGVYGQSTGTTASNGNGVYGLVSHVGSTQVTAGVFGDSSASYGVLGRTTAVNYSGCTGIADGTGRAAFAGAGTNGAYGAYFVGPTVVQGDFTVVGGQKNAAVKQGDGSYRVLHCVESPEAWFEDFGEGRLVNGQAVVALRGDFAGVVETSGYHVFLTPGGESQGLYVSGKTGTGFVVREQGEGRSSVPFSWRVVAKRKDIRVGRMARFALPGITLPTGAELPPEPPMPPPAPVSPVPVVPVPPRTPPVTPPAASAPTQVPAPVPLRRP